MPIYVYEAEEASAGCSRCRDSFEVRQSISDAPLAKCPDCGSPVHRVIQAPALGRSKTDLAYRAKRAGFHALKRIGKGEYEKAF